MGVCSWWDSKEVILHCYSERNYIQQLDTWQAIKKLQERWTVVSELTTFERDDSYWEVLMKYWGKGRLIQFQQDIVPTVDQIQELMDCNYWACTYPHKLTKGYGLWEGTWTDDSPVFYNKHGEINMNGLQPSSITLIDPPFPEYVQGAGIALVKLSKEIQQQIPLADYPMSMRAWDYIDTWISAYMHRQLDIPWHVHTPPVKHNHY